MAKQLTTPITHEQIMDLRAGDSVEITGVIYTGRDAAHKRLCELVAKGEELPFDVKDQVIYYVGPAPASPGHAIGSAGPTSSYRMDAYSYTLMKEGLKVMIGKGNRSAEYKEQLKEQGAVYLCAVGGAAALIAQSVKKMDLVAYEDLGAEAIYRLEVEKYPAIVTYDAYGGDLITEGVAKYKKIDI